VRAYRILDTNAWLAGGELDVVARRGGTIVFCEVKSKSADGFGDPLEMVTPLKVERLHRAAGAWLAANRGLAGLERRFDVAAERAGRLQVVQDAF